MASGRVALTPWWHGGAPGRGLGEWLLPPIVTGHKHIWPSATPTSPFHVYISANLSFAAAHAMLYAARQYPTESRVYRVIPELPLEGDPEAPRDCPAAVTWSFRCSRAVVTDVLDLTYEQLVGLVCDPEFLRAYGLPG
jgi:hypothetical protein